MGRCGDSSWLNRTAFSSRSATAEDFSRFPNANRWDFVSCESVSLQDRALKEKEAMSKDLWSPQSTSVTSVTSETRMSSVEVPARETDAVELVFAKSKHAESPSLSDDMKESLLSFGEPPL